MSDGEPGPAMDLGVAWWAAVVGALFNLLSPLDRSVIAVLLPEIRHDLQPSAFQISVVEGLGFVTSSHPN